MRTVKYNRQGVSPRTLALSAGLTLGASSPVSAHHPMGSATPETFGQGLLSGLGHPIIGVDHFAFIFVAMLLTCVLRGGLQFLVPIAFVGAGVAGTVLYLGAANIPMFEALVALSVVAGGVLAFTRRYTGAFLLGSVFAASGILHGYAYGGAIIGAEAAPLMAYLIGLAAVQYALIVGGALGMQQIARYSESLRTRVTKVGSGAAVLTGAVFLFLNF